VNASPSDDSLEGRLGAPAESEVGSLYRMPWTAADNALTWLEPTRKCNITCDACFAANDPRSQKPLAQIEDEVKAMLTLRRCDGMLIAGGEPLTHPHIVDVVRIVKAHSVKPVLLTNGVALTKALLSDLKRAGLFGFTFHVDKHQTRPGWVGKGEVELNALRQELADMVHEEGGLVCGFNMTVFPDTLPDVPAVVAWALRNVDRVQSYTLTALRLVEVDSPFDFYAGGAKIDVARTVYGSPTAYRKLTSQDLLAEVQNVIPDFRVSAFLGGTVRPNSLKWSVGCRLASVGASYGNLGPRSMELLQTAHHLLRGRYLAFARPSLNRKAKLMLFFGVFDPEVRRALGRYLAAVVRNPVLAARRLYVQSIVVEQPFDLLANGEQDHCDGCPNKTLWKDRLVPACILEEYLRYGAPAVAVPKPH
jgi:hypothetical protein